MSMILVVIDPDETEHAGLDRIKAMPVDDIHFMVNIYIERYSTTLRDRQSQARPRLVNQAPTANSRLAWLEQLVQPIRDLGYKIETAVVLFDRLYEAIIQSAASCHADFVFKPLRQHGFLRRALFSATDWNLVRCCPQPLLLISHAYPIKGKPVLAAVDVAAADEPHIELNRIVLAQARLFAVLLASHLHLVNAFSLSSLTGASPIADPLAYQVMRQRHQQQLDVAVKLGQGYQIEPERIYLREGPAEAVINDRAAEIGAGVIVMGTVARSGVSGLFIGNTAEAVMEHTQCDVVVVKQADFKSPVRPA
jgi:universal stress protein E